MIKLLIALLISVGAYAQCTLVLNPKTRVLECAGGTGNVVGPASATNGAVAYNSGTSGKTLASSSVFCWDSVNNRLGVGTCAPGYAISVAGGGYVRATTPDGNSDVFIGAPTNGQGWIGSLNTNPIAFLTNSTERARFAATSGNFLIGGGTTDGGFRADINTSGSSGTFRVYDATATTGTTKAVFRAGAGQGTSNVFEIQNNAGSVFHSVLFAGSTVMSRWHQSAASAAGVQITGSDGFKAGSNYGYNFSSTTDSNGTADTGLYRSGSGLVEINNGTAGTFRDLRVRDLITTLATPASATAACTAGTYEADANYIYICTATNTWKRVAIATW